MRLSKIIVSFFILLFSLSIFIVPQISRAGTCIEWDTSGIQTDEHCITWDLDNSGLVNPLGDDNSTVEGLLNSIIDWLLIIATPIAVGMVLVGAFQMIFAGGDEEKFKLGKRTILYTAIGYAIILVGRGITLVIQDLLSR